MKMRPSHSTDFKPNDLPDRIFLIGFMGSGKTFYGKKLADKLGWEFIDLDEKIEQGAGMKVPEIFKKNGPSAFRKLEQAALRQSFISKKTIIATGGGTPCFFENMAEMLENGLVIFLKTPTQLLASRLWGQQEGRPLIVKTDKVGLLGFIKTELHRRRAYYRRAQITVAQPKNDPDFLAKIIRALLAYLPV